ncbi:MAG: 23S rRNA (uracil(1939)-C(5))-methyltransferase RlmD [Clostridia bacterium]|nr:23S rRNA (uracil(1939)-C(5))-methyltransferase RlmD [Clostridia bacterium]
MVNQRYCESFKKCGGCTMLNMTYEEQLKVKENKCKDILRGIVKTDKIVGMADPWYYRNKVHRTFSSDRRGRVHTGTYEPGSHRMVQADKCLLENRRTAAIVEGIRLLVEDFRIPVFNETTMRGYMRRVLIRTSRTTGEIMVVLVVADLAFPCKNDFMKVLRQNHPEISTLILNVNRAFTPVILGPRSEVVFGKGYIEDTLCGKVFRISPSSFFQINPVQTELLYQTAIDLAEINDSDLVVDAYCGIGTIGIIAADKAWHVVGVENNKSAVKDAVINKRENGLTNMSLYCRDAGEFLEAMANDNEEVDVVFMDPPRTGSTRQFMDSVIRLSPRRVVYISCNPETLARDLKYMCSRGYAATRAIPFDQFPWTEHTECVALLINKSLISKNSRKDY